MSIQQKIYDTVAETMIEAMESDDGVPWRKEWTGSWLPRNGYSGRLYNGINVWLLQSVAWRRGFTSNDWFTFKSANKANGNVMRGEKSPCFVIYWKNVEKKDDQDINKTKRFMFMRYFPVWNKNQIKFDRMPNHAPEVEDEGPCIGGAEACLEHMVEDGVTMAEGEPCFIPRYDRVEMPPKGQFITGESYASTLFHELSHATMQPDRLHRTIPSMNKEEYAKEELIAELSSSYLCQYYQISSDLDERHAKYLKHWTAQIKQDPKYIFQVARQAQEAARYVLNYKEETVWRPLDGSKE
tara:strand:+ start:701 stop:1591 length:891 start_codon:yes stop_codon:yes gene_type:complete